MSEIYVSTDVETNGPIPGEYSMLSFGSVAYDEVGKEIAYFYRTLLPLENAKEHPDTMKWWKSKPEAWKEVNTNKYMPEVAMSEYYEWLRLLPGKPIFVGYPASFDFMFIYWYLMKFVGESPFGFQALDMKTYAWSILGGQFKNSVKANFPKEWFSIAHMHTHNALDDAREQGDMFFRMKSWNK